MDTHVVDAVVSWECVLDTLMSAGWENVNDEVIKVKGK